MGKTKTSFVEGKAEEKKSGKEAYEEKMRKKAEKEAATKTQVKGVGLKGGDRIKVVGADLPSEEPNEIVATSDLTNQPSQPEKKPKTRSKKYKDAKAKVSSEKLYKIEDAIKLLKDIKFSSFDETVELHFVTKGKGLITNLTLPHSGGKVKKIEVADDSTIEKLKAGKVDFDMLLATADMMPKLVPFARMLGPRGMMPNPKNGTLIKSKKDAEKFSGNTLTLKTEKEQPVVHTAVGKLSQKENELEDNAKAVLNAFPKQVVKAYIKSTMSPSVKLQV